MAGKAAEICQLSAIDKSGLHTFSHYILPNSDIQFQASKVNQLAIKSVNGQRTLFKDNKAVIAVSLQKVITEFLLYISRSINRAKSETTRNSVVTVLIGHNAATFDTPVLLRNGGKDLAAKLQSMNIFFGDSLALMKALVKSSHPCLKSADGSIS